MQTHNSFSLRSRAFQRISESVCKTAKRRWCYGASVRPASSQVQGHSVHLSVEQGCPCLACRSRGLTGEGRDRPGPSSRDEVRVLQPLLHRTQERRWVTTNLGPARSEPGPSQAPVQDVDGETHLSMHPSLRLVCSDRPEGRLLPCLDPPSTQTVLRFAFEGRAYQYKALPFGLSLPSLEHCCANTGIWCSVTSAGWGFRSTGERANSPIRRGSLFSAWSWTRSTSQHVSQRSVLSQCWDAWSLSSTRGRFNWNIFRGSWGIWHPQPRSRRSDCSIWDRFSVGFTTGSRDGHGATARTRSQSPRPAATPSAHGRTLLSSGRSSPRASIQACCCFNRHLYYGLGGPCATGMQLRGSGQGPSCSGISIASSCWQNGLLCATSNAATLQTTDNTATVAYINHQGSLRSRRMSQLARHLLLWSQKHLRSLRAVHVPGELNRAADELSRQPALPWEWRLHPEVLQLIWRCFRDAQVDLFASPDTSHCQLFFSLSEGTLGTDALACNWPRGPCKYFSPSEPSRTEVQGQGGRGASPFGGALLAQSDLVPRTDTPRDSPSLANSSEEGSLFSEKGHPLAPASGLVESPRMVPGWDAEVLGGLPPAVVNTITSARALSTRHAYRLKWNLFVDWCSPRREDPRRCTIVVVLSFLQDGLERRLSPSTLKVYVAAIAAHHDAVDDKSVGKHDLVIRSSEGRGG